MKQPLPEKAICREGRLFSLFVLPQKGSYEIEAIRTTEEIKHQQINPGRNLRPFSCSKKRRKAWWGSISQVLIVYEEDLYQKWYNMVIWKSM